MLLRVPRVARVAGVRRRCTSDSRDRSDSEERRDSEERLRLGWTTWCRNASTSKGVADEGSGAARATGRAGDRGRDDRRSGTRRGARRRGRRRPVPQRPALHAGQVPHATAGGARPRIGRRRRAPSARASPTSSRATTSSAACRCSAASASPACRDARSPAPTRPPGARTGADAAADAADGEKVEAFSHLGGFAEQMLVHERAVVRIADDLPLDRAALVGCAVLTGTGAVFRTARVEPGSTVAVIGAGGIGLAAIQGARIAGAGMVIADRRQQREAGDGPDLRGDAHDRRAPRSTTSSWPCATSRAAASSSASRRSG